MIDLLDSKITYIIFALLAVLYMAWEFPKKLSLLLWPALFLSPFYIQKIYTFQPFYVVDLLLIFLVIVSIVSALRLKIQIRFGSVFFLVYALVIINVFSTLCGILGTSAGYSPLGYPGSIPQPYEISHNFQ